MIECEISILILIVIYPTIECDILILILIYPTIECEKSSDTDTYLSND